MMPRLAHGMLALLLVATALPAQAGMLVAAHRAHSGAGQPENSLGALRASIAAGIAIAEVDLRTTADDQIILFHDATLKRTAGRNGRVSRMTLAQLKQLDLGGGERIATLAEALALVRGTGTRLLLDLKEDGKVDARRAIEEVRRHGDPGSILIGARSVADVSAARALDPSVAILGFTPKRSDIDAFARAGANAIRLWPEWAFDRRSGCAAAAAPACLVQQLQARGLAVWIIDHDPADFARIEALGFDAILTDRPDLAAASLARR
jgi:glycerophosphoryl diester phosphodiesterase